MTEKSPVSSDIELGVTCLEPDAVGDDQRLTEKTSQDINDEYAGYAGEAPDGGFKAWSVIVASMLTTFCSLGYVNSTWGVFQDYYEQVLLPDENPSTMIGSGKSRFISVLGTVSAHDDFSTWDISSVPYFIASCGLVACTFLTAECAQYWQFFLAQDLFTGLFSGIIYGQAISVVSHWFSKKKGMALGVVSIGSSLGGTLFPIAAQNLIPRVGFKWTVRACGFVILIALGIANLTIDRRLPPVNFKGGLLNLSVFRNPAYTIYCISGIACFLGLYTMLTYLSVSAMAVGVSANFSFYLVAVANAASGFGRLSAGKLADRIGPLNTMILFTSLAGILTFVWPYASSQGLLIGVSVLYGFASGTYVSLFVAPPMAMGGVGDVGRRMGMFLTIAALGTIMLPCYPSAYLQSLHHPFNTYLGSKLDIRPYDLSIEILTPELSDYVENLVTKILPLTPQKSPAATSWKDLEICLMPPLFFRQYRTKIILDSQLGITQHGSCMRWLFPALRGETCVELIDDTGNGNTLTTMVLVK
ncbi:major facilitator superfamily domain-containing protein [Pisolithus marmoratus]|nr:major facilitator superfamily domain-containing protein [Pisolithus marmoratus]